MTTAHDIDWPAVLADRLTTTHPDVLRELLSTFIHTLLGAEADVLCGAGYGERSAERTNQRNGYRHREFDTRTGTLDLAIPKLRQGSYFPDWLLERRKRAERALADHGGGDLLSSRGLDAADGQTRRQPGHHVVVEVAGVGDGQGTRYRGGGVPNPTVGRRPVHVRRRRRPGAQGPRGRPGGQRACPDRGRGQRRGLPRDPRCRRHHRRGRGRLAELLAVADRPRPVRRQAGHQRRARRAG